ncbi:MAG: hypothetical protein PHR35_13010 [Kiritimatiellae bacterium]|nr:hypothetical protein [Kiritimatiellia bacterium]
MNCFLHLGYLDPGTGSVALQLIVGGLLGAALVVKTFWRRIVGIFKRGNPPATGHNDEPAQ